MKYLLLMTFSGSALFLGYLFWESILGKLVTQNIKYKALVIVLLVFIVPWVWLKGIYIKILLMIRVDKIIADSRGVVNIAEIKTREEAYRTQGYYLLMLFMVIWFVGAAAFMFMKIVKYLRMKHALYALALKGHDVSIEKTVEKVRRDIRCKRRMKIVRIQVEGETLSMGAIKPVIFLQTKYNAKELYLILKHEMIHISRMDLLIKLIVEFVCCLHWFNPLIYILERKIEFLCETSCDEKVITNCTEDEYVTYIELLNKYSPNNQVKNSMDSMLENNASIRKRICLVKETQKVSNWKKIVAIGVFVSLIAIDSFIALAYPVVQHVEDAVVEAAKESVSGSNFWLYDYAEEGYDILPDKILYDEQFINAEGTIYPVASDTTEIVCDSHDFMTGYIQTHIQDTDGSCTIDTYEGARCTKCGAIREGEFYSSNTQITCSHVD